MNPDELLDNYYQDTFQHTFQQQDMSHSLDELLDAISGVKKKPKPALPVDIAVSHINDALARATRMLHENNKKLMESIRVDANGEIIFEQACLETVESAHNYVKCTFTSFSDDALAKFFATERVVLKMDSMLLRFCHFTPNELEIISKHCSTRAMQHLETHSLQVKHYNEISKV